MSVRERAMFVLLGRVSGRERWRLEQRGWRAEILDV